MSAKDIYGRSFKKMRVSLLDACNFRCTYCMPEDTKFMPMKNSLSSDEIFKICENLVEHGIEAIRLTGGEPTLRSDFLEIMQKLSSLNIKKLGVTSNAIKLTPLLEELTKTKLNSINISLDSLIKEKFHQITKSDTLEKVIECIIKAKKLGFKVKINVVVMNGVNSDEILDFVEFSQKYDVEVRFLEIMKIGVAIDKFNEWFLPTHKIISLLKKHYTLTKIDKSKDSTSFNYRLNNGANIGFIASESIPFCSGCSRLRLGPTGALRACLMKSDSVNIRYIPKEKYPLILSTLINNKPVDRIYLQNTPMHQIGG